MPFSEKQLEFYQNASHRWNFKTGAVRSGKTYADYFTIPKRIRARIGKPGLSFIFGVSKATIERNILEPMRVIWGPELVGDIKMDNTAYLFGDTVYCLGCEKVSQVAKIRGASIKYAYGDEVAEWNPEVFELIKSRLDKEYSCFDGALNPEGPNHWLKQFLDSDADIYNQHYTIFDNPYLPQEFIENLCKEYEGTVYYDRYIKGLWALAEGVIYPMYQDALFTEMPCKMPEFERLCLSIDYGTQNAFAALLWGKFKGIWYAYKGYYYSGRKTGVQKTDTEYLVDLEKTFSDEITRYRSAKEANGKNAYMTTMPRKIETIIDPSAASFIALLEKQDWCSVQKAKNDVLDGIRDTAVAMKTGKIKVYSGIKEWQNEVKGYVWDEKAGEKGDEQPLKINDHYMDATRYFVYTKEIAKVRREYKPLYM
jgi:PBSX family phage terminase large subunit